MLSPNPVSAAEKLLQDIKRLDVTDGFENAQLRRAVAQSAAAIIRDTSDPVDYMKSQWVKVCPHSSS